MDSLANDMEDGARPVPARDGPDHGAGSSGTVGQPRWPEIASRISRRSGARALAIIGGRDDRRIELRSKYLPWRLICSLEISTANGRFRGTGWLAGPQLVMTAGHCVYRPEEFGGWATAITVSPGRNWQEQPFGRFESTRFSCAADWIRTGRRETDLGCIHLAEPIGRSLGWFRFAAADPAALAGVTVVASGYPEYAGSYDNLLTAAGVVRDLAPGRIFYDVDTTDGQSGSPVWAEADDAGDPTVVAIHAYEPDPGRAGNFNSAVLLTTEALGLIAGWQNPQ